MDFADTTEKLRLNTPPPPATEDIMRGLSRLTLADRLVHCRDNDAQLRDYYNGSYRKIPWWAISAITVVLLYFLNPLDIIPDFIPLIGQIDDILVLMVGIRMIKRELERYMEWKYPGESPESWGDLHSSPEGNAGS